MAWHHEYISRTFHGMDVPEPLTHNTAKAGCTKRSWTLRYLTDKSTANASQRKDTPEAGSLES